MAAEKMRVSLELPEKISPAAKDRLREASDKMMSEMTEAELTSLGMVGITYAGAMAAAAYTEGFKDGALSAIRVAIAEIDGTAPTVNVVDEESEECTDDQSQSSGS